MEAQLNHLKNESSPYLLMHATNPVDWYPWGDEAFNKAKQENKLVIVSIGYAACHWCHVMENESFSTPEVAEIMNKYFISIKVDREERPDVDQVFMEVAQRISGKGGWPLNAIALPNREPVYALTYLPQNNWIDFLHSFQKMWMERPTQFYDQADALVKSISEATKSEKVLTPFEYKQSDLTDIQTSLVDEIDPDWGGFGQAPKFPLPAGLELLMKLSAISQDEKSNIALETTLQRMALGGLFDRIEGGFARYSVDAYWRVPHFEKMLYDNGQLASLYAHAYQYTKNPFYKEVLDKTLQFVIDNLTSPEGAFYSSLDADSEGEEGNYYVWKSTPLKIYWGEKAEILSEYFNITDRGNWEFGKNVLFATKQPDSFARSKDIDPEEFSQLLQWSDKTLSGVRSTRVKPGLDDKILTSWNGLMIQGFIDGYRATGNTTYLDIALKASLFIFINQVGYDNRVNHAHKEGKSTINGFLDDYAYLISAFINLYQVTFDKNWLDRALRLTNYVLDHFYDKESGMIFYTSDLDRKLVSRRLEIYDNVMPSPNAVMANNLFLLGEIFHLPDFLKTASQMLRNVYEKLPTSGPYMANWSKLLILEVDSPYEVAIVGPKAREMADELQKEYIPGMILMGGDSENGLQMLENRLVPDKTYIYVCKDKTCRLPVESVKEALDHINDR